MWPELIAGAIGAGGAAYAGSASAKAANDINERTIEYQKNRYQYTVDDLKKAGLNPMLAVHGMTPGNAPQLQQPNYGPAASILNTAANTAVGAYSAKTARSQQEAQAKLIDSQTQLQKLQGANSAADTATKLEQAKQIDAQTRFINEQTLTQVAQRLLMNKQAANYSANTAKTQYDTAQSKVLADYLKTPEGAESALVNMDAARGGLVGLINTGLSSFRRDLKRDSPPHSAKKVNEQSKHKPTAFERGLIQHYSMNK